VKIIKLEQNYRSTNVILQAANALIKHNVRRRGKQLWSRNGPGRKITLHAFKNDEEEARAIVEDIELARLSRRARWGEAAVLFRTNQQSRPFEIALRQAGVRYRLIGGQSYFDRREVRDLLAYLKFFLNPHDDVSLLRIANVPARGLSDATMERLLAASQERHGPVWSALRDAEVQSAFAPRTRESLRAFVDFAERTRRRLEADPTLSLQAWAEDFLGEIGYLDELRRSEKNPETAESRLRNLRELVHELDGASPGGAAGSPADRLQAFLEELALDSEREADEETNAGDAVTLITMHSCKGLEFPHVYVAGLEDGLVPHAHSKTEGTLDEERRLFYVAITRAQETLTLSHCQGRRRYGQVLPCHPSPFLKELPPELVELADEKGCELVSPEAGRDFFAALREAVG
jgi:superfamily I DNA/RNA helicase